MTNRESDAFTLMIDDTREMLASIAISLKRIADLMTEFHNGRPPPKEAACEKCGKYEQYCLEEGCPRIPF